MKIATLAMLMVMTLTAADSAGTEWRATPRLAAAMKKAWGDSAGSFVTNIEAGFRVDNGATGETVIATHITNQGMRQKMDLVPRTH